MAIGRSCSSVTSGRIVMILMLAAIGVGMLLLEMPVCHASRRGRDEGELINERREINSKPNEEVEMGAIKMTQDILDKTWESKLQITAGNNDKEWIKTILNEYGPQEIEPWRRTKRDADTIVNVTLGPGLNGRITVQATSTITAPPDRMSLVAARWIMVIGGIVILICAICIVYFYCRCKVGIAGRIHRLRGDSFVDNPRATVSVVPSRALRRPPRNLNNDVSLNYARVGPGSCYQGAQGAAANQIQFLKSLEKDPEGYAANLMGSNFSA